jgi:hypothetical protein
MLAPASGVRVGVHVAPKQVRRGHHVFLALPYPFAASPGLGEASTGARTGQSLVPPDDRNAGRLTEPTPELARFGGHLSLGSIHLDGNADDDRDRPGFADMGMPTTIVTGPASRTSSNSCSGGWRGSPPFSIAEWGEAIVRVGSETATPILRRP